MAEHAYIDLITSATGITPFNANFKKYPKSQNPQRLEVMNPALHAHTHWIAGILKHRKMGILVALKGMTKYADTRRTPPLAYKVGDAVMLSTAHLLLKWSSRQLDDKFISPFQIQQLIFPTAVRLMLPHKWRTHPTIYIVEIEQFVTGKRPVNYEKVQREVSDIKADEEFLCGRDKGIHLAMK